MTYTVLLLAIGSSFTLVGGEVVGRSCPDKWVDASFVDMGCLMFYSNSSMTWEEANVYCQESHKATLVEFGTQEQLDFVRMELEVLEELNGPKNWWTSGTDIGRDGIWYWASSLTHVADFVWDPQDNIVHGPFVNCLELFHGSNGYMGFDMICDDKEFPICQMK